MAQDQDRDDIDYIMKLLGYGERPKGRAPKEAPTVEVMKLPLDQIGGAEQTQFRDALSEATLEWLDARVEVGWTPDPIVVVERERYGLGAEEPPYLGADGWHRMEMTQRRHAAGLGPLVGGVHDPGATITARVVRGVHDPLRVAQELNVRINLQPAPTEPTAAERRKGLLILMRLHPGVSANDLALMTGVKKTTIIKDLEVLRVRAVLEGAGVQLPGKGQMEAMFSLYKDEQERWAEVWPPLARAVTRYKIGEERLREGGKRLAHMMALPRPPEKDSHEAHWGWLEFHRDDANPHVTEAERLVLCAQAERHGWTDEQLLSVAHHVADLAQGYDEKRDERSARLDERASILAGEVPDPRDAGWYEAQGGVQAPYTIVGREAWEQAAPGGRAPAQTPEPAVPGGPPPEPAPPAPPAAPAPPVTTDVISSNALAPAPPVPGGPATPEEEAAAAADEGPREGTYDAQAMERCRMALEQIQQGTETLNFYREVFMKYAAVEEVDDLADYGAMLGELARAASEEGEEGEQ